MHTRTLTLILAGLLLISGATSVFLWRSLQAEKRLSSSLAVRSNPDATVETRSAAAVVHRPNTVDDGNRSCVAEVWQPTEEFLAVAEAIITKIPKPLSGVPTELELLQDPEYRKLALARIRFVEAYSHPGLAEALGLNESEANQIFQLQAESQLKLMMEVSNSTRPTAVAFTDAVKRLQKSDDPIKGLLGNARYAELTAYNRDIRPALMELSNITRTLASAGQPLIDSQIQSLKGALLSMQQGTSRQMASPQSYVDQAGMRSVEQVSSEVRDRQEDRKQRILTAIAPHLRPAQLAVYQQKLEADAASRNVP
jgi:hypothetical protein